MKKETSKNRILKVIPVLVLLAAVVTGAIYAHSRVSAVFDTSKAIKFGAYSKTHTIPDQTLFIGVYLINLQAMNDDLYKEATKSASDSGQDQMYYKSELSGGTWYNISDAGSLAEISTGGAPAGEAEMKDLYVRYVVGADGILIDALDNKERNPFDLVSPYDLTKLPELEPLRLQYTFDAERTGITEEAFLKNRNAKDAGTVRTGVYYYQLLTSFFTLNLRDEDTDKCDEQLDRLYSCYKALMSAGNKKEADLVYSLMGKVDATRRAIVMEKLNQYDENSLGELYNLSTGTYYTSKGNFKDADTMNESDAPVWITPLRDAVKHDFFSDDAGAWIQAFLRRIGVSSGDWWSVIAPSTYGGDDDEEEEDEDEEEKGDAFAIDNAILDAISSCMENCTESYNEVNTNRLQDVDTVLGHYEYVYSMQVIDGASAAGLNGDTLNLRYLTDIKNGVINEAEPELALIDGTLLPEAESRYTTDVKAPAGEKYAAAVANNRGESAMKEALEDQKAYLEARRSELQHLITEKRRRMPAEPMLEHIYQRITIADSWRDTVSGDAFGPKAKLSVDEHIAWLKDVARQIKEENEGLESDLDKLKDKRDDLTAKMQAALDDNDLEGAADYQALIDAVNQDIGDEETRLANLVNNANSAGEAAEALVDMGDSVNALADDLLDKAKERAGEGDTDGLENSIDTLAGLGDADALEELKEVLEDEGAPASLLNNLDNAIDEARANGSLLNDGSGSGSGSGSGLGANDLAGMFGDAGSMSDDELAATITTLSRLNDDGNLNAGPLAQDYAYQGQRRKNPYVYAQYADDHTQEYVSIEAIGAVTKWRYVYDDKRQTATLTHGNRSWEFTVGSSTALQGGKNQVQLSAMAVFQGVNGSGSVFILEKDAKELLACDAQYVKNSDAAVCVTEKVDIRANELYDRIFETGEE